MKISKTRSIPKIKLLSILLIMVLTITFLKYKPLLIKEVDIKSASFSCGTTEDVKKNLNLENMTFFSINETEIKKHITDKYICLSDVKINYTFPKKIEVELTTRVPLVKAKDYQSIKVLDLDNLEASSSSDSALLDWSVPVSASHDAYLIDKSGVVFEQNDEISLPLVFVADQNLSLGKRFPENYFLNIDQIINKLPSFEISSQETKIISSNYQILTKPQIVFNLEKDVLRQLASLQLILSKAKIDSKVVEVVDLRFDKPVVIYSQDVKKR